MTALEHRMPGARAMGFLQQSPEGWFVRDSGGAEIYARHWKSPSCRARQAGRVGDSSAACNGVKYSPAGFRQCSGAREQVAIRLKITIDHMEPVDIRVVLVATSHPGNIVAAARAMKNMALRSLVLVNPRQFPHAEASARASGADDVLAAARVVSSLTEALAGCG